MTLANIVLYNLIKESWVKSRPLRELDQVFTNSQTQHIWWTTMYLQRRRHYKAIYDQYNEEGIYLAGILDFLPQRNYTVVFIYTVHAV